MAEIELHVHPFLWRNRIQDVVESMEKNGLDIIAMESLDDSVYPRVVEETKKAYPIQVCDDSGIRLQNGRYFLNAGETTSEEDLHIITIGHSCGYFVNKPEARRIIDNGLENGALILLDHSFSDNGKTKTAGHISGELEQELEKICKEYSGKIALEWNGYCIPWVRLFLEIVLNAFGFDIRYHDVNQKAEELSARLKENGYNVPVVADTDLHARTKRHLQEMGTARIIMDIEGETPRDVVYSMRRNIFNGDYENVKRYVSPFHLLGAFCVPILFSQYFEKPRA